MLCTSSVTDIRLRACIAASWTFNVARGCLMHFTKVAFIDGSAASIVSPMLPITCNSYGIGCQKTCQKLQIGTICNDAMGDSELSVQPYTYPQGQEGRLFLASAVRTQNGRHELGHISNLRSDFALSLVKPNKQDIL